MEKKKIIKAVKIVIAIIAILFLVSIFRACQRIDDYKVNVLYEDLTLTEKIAATLKGYDFNTKEEAIEKGLIFSDTNQEAHNIADIFTPITELMGTNDGTNTQIKIDKCEEVLKKLHEENESGRVTGSDLISLMNDCINTVENYKYALKANQNLDVGKYKNYSDKTIESYRNATNDLERLNKQ